MKFHESGVTYKASKRAFLGNYLLVIGIVLLAFLVIRTFNLEFDITFSSQDKLIGTLVYLGFGVASLYLALEFLIQGILKKYVVSNHDIVMIEGIFWKRRLSIPYQSIAEVKVVRGIFGRMLNYGTVEVTGFKEAEIVMKHMIDPEGIQRMIQNKIGVSKRGPKKEDKAQSSVE